MVAGLVLSAGLLGLAAMQTKALKTANGLATQQAMVQALGAFGEARLANPNHNIVDRTGPDNENAQKLATYCNSLWTNNPVAENGEFVNQILSPTAADLTVIRSLLSQYTTCGSSALTEYADYWNMYGAYQAGAYGNVSSHNGTECDYIVPRTRTVSCTLPTGDVISLSNMVWVR
jgi:Tfp pilus assembly protein PilV